VTDSTEARLYNLKFDNRFVAALPADPRSDNSPRQVHRALYSKVEPTAVSQPRTIACSPEVAALLDLHPDVCHTDLFAQVFSGNKLLPGMDPYATCYGGHQFGQWAGQLGDGRAINLGENLTPTGRHLTLQLKGAGRTPYSRGADGRAVLRSSVREFLCSEAMYHLGVPTTRALSLVLTGDKVVRDMFYDGNPAAEPGAIVCRVAPSFTRFGHFQLLAARGEDELLKQLVDFTITADFPHLLSDKVSSLEKHELYLRWFEEICQSTIAMIIHWQRVGFVHGVMNTDNMSILGLTIDYGPYGWIDNYDPDWTPNTTDFSQRRYRFGQQSAIARWNLYQLANALLPLIKDAEPLQQILENFVPLYEAGWGEMMANKLGIGKFRNIEDMELFAELEKLLCVQETDMTIFFRALSKFDPENLDNHIITVVSEAFYAPPSNHTQQRYLQWEIKYRTRLLQEQSAVSVAQWAESRARMDQTNPLYVLRNYLAQTAIDGAEQGDYTMISQLLKLLRHPCEEQAGCERFAVKRPEWARHKAGCSALSCSS
jgi:uncharacterized protein YdiU (UPF0061 family)